MLVSGNRVYHGLIMVCHPNLGSQGATKGWSNKRWVGKCPSWIHLESLDHVEKRPWKLRCSVSLKANPFNKYFPNPKKRTNCYGKYLWKIPCCSLPHRCTMKKNPPMRSPCWIRSHPKHLACSYVAARFQPGARRSPPRSPSWNAGKSPKQMQVCWEKHFEMVDVPLPHFITGG